MDQGKNMGVPQATPQAQEPKKGKSPLLPILFVVVILLIVGVVVFFVFFNDGEDEVDTQFVPQEEMSIGDIDEDDITIIGGTELSLNDELEGASDLPEDFPQDLPLSGGLLTIYTSDSLAHNVQISVKASLSEAQRWYQSALTSNGWEITEVSEYSPMDMLNEQSEGEVDEQMREILEQEGFNIVEIQFEKAVEGRRGDITITANPYTQTVDVVVREVLANF